MENLLIVEGPDDVHVISQLLNEHGLTRLRDSRDKNIWPFLKLFFEDRILNIKPTSVRHFVPKQKFRRKR